MFLNKTSSKVLRAHGLLWPSWLRYCRQGLPYHVSSPSGFASVSYYDEVQFIAYFMLIKHRQRNLYV